MRPPVSIWAFACALGLAILALACDALADPHGGSPAAAQAAAVVMLRTGEHPGFSRIVFDLPAAASADVASLHDGLLVKVAGAALTRSGAEPRGLSGLAVSGSSATLSWAPGTAVHTWRLPGRLVIDVLRAPLRAAPRPHGVVAPASTAGRLREPADPPFAAPALAPTMQAPSKRAPAPAGLLAEHPVPILAATLPAPDISVPAPLTAAARIAVDAAPIPPVPAGPLAVAAEPAASAGTAGSATLPFGSMTGAAAFRRGAWGIAVFDEARPVDLARLRSNAGLAGAEIRELPAATMLRVKLPSDRALALTHRPDGWSVVIVPAAPAAIAIRPETKSGVLDLPFDRPGQVVSVPDPETGGLLLVGTQAPPAVGADAPAQGIALERRTPSFSLPATWRGVVVEPQSDDLVLRATPDAFVVQRGGGGPGLPLADTEEARPDEAGRFSRRFDLPGEPLLALDRRLRAAEEMAAAEPEQARGPARLGVAQAMLALGMGAEADAVVRLACTDDPRLERDPQAIAIRAAAALVAGRTGEGGAIDDPALSASGQPGLDEVQLWRGLRAAQRADEAGGADPAAAQLIAAKLPLLESYPEPLRNRLLPLALRTMAQGGEAEAARRAVDAQPAIDASISPARCSTSGTAMPGTH